VAHPTGMHRVLACVDASDYANSVCDYAAWFASDPDIGVEVLHVAETVDVARAGSRSTALTDPVLHRAVQRLREEGVGPISSMRSTGDLVDLAARHEAGLIVMGKRGENSAAERLRLGSNVETMIRGTAKPVCLTSKIFLPIHRAVVLLDADLDHRAAVAMIVSDFRLAPLALDVVVMASSLETAKAKVEWARAQLSGLKANVLPMISDGLDEAVALYMEARAADLVIISRAVVAPDPQDRLARIDQRGLWGARTPVLIC